MATPRWLPDWRDASAYRFERLDRAGFAWEWLRRDPDYCAAAGGANVGEARRGGDAATRWGLIRFEPAELAAPAARPLWRAAVDREVLEADGSPCTGDLPGALRLDRLGGLVTIVMADGIAHILLCDGWRRVRIDVRGGADPGRPTLLRWQLAGVRLQPQLLVLRRLVSVARSGQFPNRLWPRDPRARRWILALRAHDALTAGTGHRELAELLGADAAEGRWRVREPTARLQAQRLAALARSLRGRAFADRYMRLV